MRQWYKYIIVFLLCCVLLPACSNSDDPPETSNVTEISVHQNITGSISAAGEVDWYHFSAVEANRILNVKCTTNTYRPDEALLVNVYEVDSAGNKVMLYGDHAKEGSELPTDLDMNLYIDRPKEMYISVRDLMDDDTSSGDYFLSIDFAVSDQGNNNFSEAIPIVVNDDSTCRTDTIGTIGDMDFFRFNAAADGIYAVQVALNAFQNTDVRLCVDIYDTAGALLESLKTKSSTSCYLRPYLTAGDYYIMVYENGNDDFDNASPYQVCVNTIESVESGDNDSIDTATVIPSGSPMQIEGSLDYTTDKDYYAITIPNGSGINVIYITLTVADIDFNYQLSVIDDADNELLTHEQAGGNFVYVTQVRAGQGDVHYLLVETAPNQSVSESAAYSMEVDIVTIDDADDMADLGNSPETAVPLVKDVYATDKYIAYRGDVDYYTLTVPALSPAQARVLEVFLNNSGPSPVEYYLVVNQGGENIRRTFDTNGGDGATTLKASVLVPASDQDVVYSFRVAEYQGDEGDAVMPYQIKADYEDIPASLPADVRSPLYYSEADELDETDAVNFRNSARETAQHKVNASIFEFKTLPLPTGVTVTPDTPEAGLTTIEFPWVAGYIDYQKDVDFFEIDLGALNGTDTDFYYDITVDFTTAADSDVEYVWEFYRYRNSSSATARSLRNPESVFAADGYTELSTVGPLNITTTSTEDRPFFVGDGWTGISTKFYIGIRDFNFLDQFPDDDWGYTDPPYYFKVKLVYHPGESRP